MNPVKYNLRTEIPHKYTWSIDEMYKDESDLDREISLASDLVGKLASLHGHVMESPSSLLNALSRYSDSMRHIENVLTYCRMKKDEDNSDSAATERFGKAVAAYTAISSSSSFLEPEILSKGIGSVRDMIAKEPGLEMYSSLLDRICRIEGHVLTEDQEYILASLGEITGASGNVFTVLNNVDLDFGTITDKDGNEHRLSIPSYISYMESDDRDLRKQAYESLYRVYRSHINTIASLYNNSVRKDTIYAELRHYKSSMEERLWPDSIPLSVYDNLINAVHEHLPSLHRYMKTRARLMGRDSISMYDVYNHVTDTPETHYTFEEAVDLVCKALKPLGDDYVAILRKGLLEERWVDVYENNGKTSGAYSFGSYDSKPYILMNFSGRLRDVFTLIHESGHSMHSYFTRHNQPYIYGDHSIFTAEVASTVNEVLLINYLLENCSDPDERAFLVNFFIDEFKGTLFRQTMFAEFEKFAHEYSEQGGTLTADNLSDKYNELNSEYYGEYVDQDDIIRYEWARIPHFYRTYYVYQYATGFSAANAIANRILTEGRSAADEYRQFLSSGSSDYPVELLKLAGVDMSTPGPVDSALKTFDRLTKELEEYSRSKRDA
ncbi:MAG: oligoendopeptidase F [Mogibacterium sp.]|nr:oligoendopeptidase F [Mogibacterium sp.]